MEWYLDVLKKYTVFEGRAGRKEFWMFTLVNLTIILALNLIEGVFGISSHFGMGILGGIYSLAVLLPSIAVAVRRLHDTDKSGWWMLIYLIPMIGMLVILFFMILESQEGSNRFGANPKEAQNPVTEPQNEVV